MRDTPPREPARAAESTLVTFVNERLPATHDAAHGRTKNGRRKARCQAQGALVALRGAAQGGRGHPEGTESIVRSPTLA